MQKLEIPFLNIPGIPSADDIIPRINQLPVIGIENNPWPQYEHTVKASFTIAHNGNAIFLKYQVEEKHVLASSSTNGDIHKDSCVEFFLRFENDENYYNLEFNCLGWAKMGYGKERISRKLLSSSIIDLVSSFCRINSNTVNTTKTFKWEMMLVIPLSVFCYSKFSTLKELKAKGNFYKCGDGLPEPHFLTWSEIKTPQPDFHQKEFFGELVFS